MTTGRPRFQYRQGQTNFQFQIALYWTNLQHQPERIKKLQQNPILNPVLYQIIGHQNTKIYLYLKMSLPPALKAGSSGISKRESSSSFRVSKRRKKCIESFFLIEFNFLRKTLLIIRFLKIKLIKTLINSNLI